LSPNEGKPLGEDPRSARGFRETIRRTLSPRKATAELVAAAQRAWVAFRDAECVFSASGFPLHGMIPAICLDKLTGKPIDDFKDSLKCQEGALDCPIPAK